MPQLIWFLKKSTLYQNLPYKRLIYKRSVVYILCNGQSFWQTKAFSLIIAVPVTPFWPSYNIVPIGSLLSLIHAMNLLSLALANRARPGPLIFQNNCIPCWLYLNQHNECKWSHLDHILEVLSSLTRSNLSLPILECNLSVFRSNVNKGGGWQDEVEITRVTDRCVGKTSLQWWTHNFDKKYQKLLV